jgi:predicted nucleic acid-binding protein
MKLVIDTGIIYALADTGDRWHADTAAFFQKNDCRLVLPVTVIPEASYLLNAHLGQKAELAFIKSVAVGEFILENISAQDSRRSLELMKQYGDANIGFVDASVAAIAERVDASGILTTDRRHFSLIRRKNGKTFDLFP